MAYDFKKEFKDLYKPSCKPSILTIPPMSDIAVRGMKYFLKTQGLDIPVLLSDIPLRY